MAFLTDRTLTTGLTTADLIHIVNPNDTSQNPAGSSYKATLGQFVSLIPPFTGGSGNCITDFYVSNIYGCSPITVQSELQFFPSTALGTLSFAQGQATTASGNYSHSQGRVTTTIGDWSHAEGRSTQAKGNSSHAEGNGTISTGTSSHSEGDGTESFGDTSHAEGLGTISIGSSSHSEGYSSRAIGDYSHAEGGTGVFTGGTSIGVGSHAEGRATISSGICSHSEGIETTALGNYSHSEGWRTISSGQYSHAEGYLSLSSGAFSHAEGGYSVSFPFAGNFSGGTSSGLGSHAEGRETISSGIASHAEGRSTIANGDFSHAEGFNTITNGSYQHAQGQYNLSSTTQSAFIIGNGTSNINRSNLVFAAGNEVDIYGDLLVSGTTSADTINITSTPTTASGLTEVLVRDTTSGEVKAYDFTYANFGLFAQTGNSTTISATTSELTLIDGGIGNLTIPANFFKPGDSFRVRMGGFVSATNSETLTVRVKSDSVILGSDTISFPNTSNRNWMLDIDFTIRTIGGIGVASIVSNGFFSFNTASDILGGGFVTVNNTTFDTTISNTLDITAEWGSNNASNAIYSVNFVLTKTF